MFSINVGKNDGKRSTKLSDKRLSKMKEIHCLLLEILKYKMSRYFICNKNPKDNASLITHN